MKEFYYARNSEKFGPYSLEELRSENITLQTLIWFEGLPSWQYAKDIEEIQSVFLPIEQVDVEQLDVEQVENDDIEIKELETGEEGTVADKSTLDTPFIEQQSVEPIKHLGSTISEDNYGYSFLDNYGFFKRPFSFKGRIRRLEWWVSVAIAHIAISIITVAIESNTDRSSNGLGILICLPVIWFALAQATKRCHDRGNSGFFMLIPFYGLWMAFGDGDVGQNQYGTNPKGRNF